MLISHRMMIWVAGIDEIIPARKRFLLGLKIRWTPTLTGVAAVIASHRDE
jgi:hypothetical protein